MFSVYLPEHPGGQNGLFFAIGAIGQFFGHCLFIVACPVAIAVS